LTPPFRHRGIVEGFYGPPYAHADRLWWVERLAALGMNTYVIAPKDDPRQREHWREPYPEGERACFAELAARGERAGVAVGFALSPGLSIRYASADDVAALVAKLRSFTALGARFLALCLDDVPTELVHAEDRAVYPSLAAAHVALAHAVRGALGPGVVLWLVPTDYAGNEASPYLEELGAALDPTIEVAWTGRTTIPPTVTAGEAQARATLLRRKPLLWDNVPVSDGPMRTMLHLVPYAGREPALAAHLSGVLLNPMQHARASYVTIAGAAAFLRDPARFDAEAAWREAVHTLGHGAEAAFEAFAHAHRFSPLTPADRDPPLEAAWQPSRRGRSFSVTNEPSRKGRSSSSRKGRSLSVTNELRALVEARITAGDALRASLDDRRLLAELEPWLAGHERESRRIAAALDLLDALAGPGDSLAKSLAYVRFEGRLTRNAPAATTSYGPRRVLYPQLVGLAAGSARFGADRALFRGCSLADEIVDFAAEAALAEVGPA
jgi:hyaluronoglucosaminidase